LAHQTRQPPPIELDRHDIPPDLRAIVSRMMAKQPDQRYQSARDVSQALLDWLTENGGQEWAAMHPVLPGSSSVILSGRSQDAATSSAVGTSGAAANAASGLSRAEPVRTPETGSQYADFLSNLAAEDSGPMSTAETRKETSRSQVLPPAA